MPEGASFDWLWEWPPLLIIKATETSPHCLFVLNKTQAHLSCFVDLSQQLRGFAWCHDSTVGGACPILFDPNFTPHTKLIYWLDEPLGRYSVYRRVVIDEVRYDARMPSGGIDHCLTVRARAKPLSLCGGSGVTRYDFLPGGPVVPFSF